MSDDLAAAAARVFELFGAVCAAPDDVATGEAADDALYTLERLLADAGRPAPADG
jgi:hypothetical protein